ncbi:MAG: methylated-DNA--[protein]-cysteine S-methyltransferase [Paramuribaculum sp.]|nr:methylated-DNA--[protein]-cysteine S-methyltransferase [Paramuribaculum sp.]
MTEYPFIFNYPDFPTLRAIISSEGINSLQFTGDTGNISASSESHPQEIERHRRALGTWLDNYFSPDSFNSRIPLPQLNPAATPFRLKIWQALLDIPYGKTLTYGQLAAVCHTSPRAAGGAVGANRIAILIPCHRIVGAKDSGGYTTPLSTELSIDIKLSLLALESRKSQLRVR